MAYHLTLYIASGTTRAERALRDLRELVETLDDAEVVFDVVDVLSDPRAADAAAILATPTLVRDLPPPERRVIGDLTERARVIEALGLDVPASTS